MVKLFFKKILVDVCMLNMKSLADVLDILDFEWQPIVQYLLQSFL